MRAHFILVLAALVCAPVAASFAQASAPTQQADGARDFDWEIGAWDTQVRVRAPLSTEESWAEFRGTSVIHGFSENRSNLVDLDIASGERHIRGVSLRLYNPQTRQWSINFASMGDGALTPPLYGAFINGRGEFYGQDTLDGRVVLVRFVITQESRSTARFEQSYSVDGGQTWIPNWIAVDTRRR